MVSTGPTSERDGKPTILFASREYKKRWQLAHPEKNREYCRRYRTKNLRQSRENYRRWYATRRQLVREIKTTLGCQICGEHDPIVLDFHHLPGNTKNPKINRNCGFLRLSITEIDAEIKKCVVLCANCHRRETAKTHNIIRG